MQQPGRRFIAGVTVAAVALVVIGFGMAAIDPGSAAGGPGLSTPASPSASSSSSATPASTLATASPPPVASPSPTPSAESSPSDLTPTPSSSPAATPQPAGFAQVGDTIFYFDPDGSQLPVVGVPGLQVQVKSGRAFYYAVAGNKYGLKAGSFAGEFMPQVTMGQPDGSSAQTGGAVLGGAVVSKLVTDTLSHITSPSDRWIVALPVDIRNARGTTVNVSFDGFGLSSIDNTPRVHVTFYGFLPLVEAVPTNAGHHVLVEGVNVTSWQVIDPARLTLPSDRLDPAHLMNQLLFYGEGPASLDFDQFVDGHVGVGSSIMDVSGDVSVSLAVDGSHADFGPDKVLQIAGVPVFVAASS